MVLEEYTYVFAIGTFFALLEAYNNGANDVANAWATSVSSRSVTYRQAMFLCCIFEITGALTVGARTAATIKNGIIPISAFQGNAPVQLLAFTCASAGAAIWVMWCTRHNAHVSSTYSLVSSIAGVGVATVGVNGVQWGWNKGSGLGAIFGGLCMAPLISAGFGAVTFMLIKLVVHMRANPVPWAVYSSPFFFLIAGTICCLSIIYKGSPRLGLTAKPGWWIAAVCLGTGLALAALAAFFFVPYVYCKVVRRDQDLKLWDIFQGPLLYRRPVPVGAERAKVPNYAVVQHGDEEEEDDTKSSGSSSDPASDPKTFELDNKGAANTANEITAVTPPADGRRVSLAYAEHGPGPLAPGNSHYDYKLQLAAAIEKHHATLRKGRGPLGWAMRQIHRYPNGAGSIYEKHNMKNLALRLPAYPIIAATYGFYYDIHKAQVGVLGTPEGRRMERVYAHAVKYENEVEFLYSFVQIITACTASFAHGANDVGNAVGVWAAMYAAWSTGTAAAAKEPVALWQIGVTAATICIGFITYGYNIMKVMGNKITYHSPSRGSSMELGAAITILLFSQYKLPVSTSMCITGATVGVGLCNGTYKAVNWQRVGLLFLSWVVTIPIAGLIGGGIMALTLNAPSW